MLSSAAKEQRRRVRLDEILLVLDPRLGGRVQTQDFCQDLESEEPSRSRPEAGQSTLMAKPQLRRMDETPFKIDTFHTRKSWSFRHWPRESSKTDGRTSRHGHGVRAGTIERMCGLKILRQDPRNLPRLREHLTKIQDQDLESSESRISSILHQWPSAQTCTGMRLRI